MIENELKCPYCGSKNIAIKSGMFVDLYTCRNCKKEWK